MRSHMSTIALLLMLLISIEAVVSFAFHADKRGELFGKRFDASQQDIDDQSTLVKFEVNNADDVTDKNKRARGRHLLLANVHDRRQPYFAGSSGGKAAQLLQNLLEIVNQRERRGRGNELFG